MGEIDMMGRSMNKAEQTWLYLISGRKQEKKHFKITCLNLEPSK